MTTMTSNATAILDEAYQRLQAAVDVDARIGDPAALAAAVHAIGLTPRPA